MDIMDVGKAQHEIVKSSQRIRAVLDEELRRLDALGIRPHALDVEFLSVTRVGDQHTSYVLGTVTLRVDVSSLT